MVKKAISIKVLEIAIKKKNHDFLSKHLIELLHEYNWSQEDIADLARQIEESSKNSSPK